MKKSFDYIKFVFQTKGIVGFFIRFAMLIKRFDLSGKKLQRALLEIERLGKKYNYKPAICIPALVLQRHNKALKSLDKKHLEFAIHGYAHINSRHLNLDKQAALIQASKEVFEKFKFPCAGFRAPYLSWNPHTVDAVAQNKLLWESNEAFLWNGFSSHIKVRPFHANAIQMLYDPLPAEVHPIIPRLTNTGVVRIPIGLPDDEILVDRFGICEPELIQEIWLESLSKAHRRGDIFVLHLHPERIAFCGKAMDALLNHAQLLSPPMWITSMDEVARWWIEKSKFTMTFQKESDRGYTVKCDCSNRASIVALNVPIEHACNHFFNSYHLINKKEFFIASGSVKPCIGIHPQCDTSLVHFLRDEGLPYEISSDESDYSLFLKGYTVFKPVDEMELLQKIETITFPIIRYWLWPQGKMSALVTTHDLDSLSLLDFLLRPFDNTTLVVKEVKHSTHTST